MPSVCLATPFSFRILLVSFLLVCVSARAAENLPVPLHIAVAGDKQQTDASILAARRYAAFWNTGDPVYAIAALSPNFYDPTLPAGRPQGLAGPLQTSQTFRTAVPDLSAEITDMVVAGDRVAVHLRLKGHFTGRFGDVVGKGQVIDFQAFDLYRIHGGQIAENWHLEDNLGLMQQMGISK